MQSGRPPHLTVGLIYLIAFSCALLPVRSADEVFAWQNGGDYRAPDFEATFAYDREASDRLEMALRKGSEADLELFRRGLRGLSIDRSTPALSSFGNSFIWGRTPQDSPAIDLMYHAAGSTNPIIAYNAVYFGLSVVRPMTEPILRTLVDLALKSEDPNLLSRIAWGGATHKDQLLHYLKPHLASENASQRRHAEVLRKIFSGELKAFDWANDQAREAARAKHASRLDGIRRNLTEGDSALRRETLELIQRDRIVLIMDESFISAFETAAQDPDVRVRKPIPSIVGEQWVWKTSKQSPEAIALMAKLSRDPSREVRYDSMYYGLSTVRHRSEDIVDRMLEMTVQDGMDNSDFRHRVTWGLRSDEATLRRVLRKWMQNDDPVRSLFAYGFHQHFFSAVPEPGERITHLLQTPEKTVANILAFGPTSDWHPQSMDEFLDAVRQELRKVHAERVLWPSNEGPPFIMVSVEETAPIKKALASSPRIRIQVEMPLSVDGIVHIGKEGSLKSLKGR